MPFTKLKLTTFGSTLETKWKQGKGVHFTRIALGDGLLGNGSMINRTSLVSERLSLQINGIVASDDATQAAVIATLDNRDITEGFPYRELALMAKDPDTGREGTYLYDNAGQECEYLDTQANGVLIYERLKMLIRVEQAETISFEASGNPLNITWTDIEPILAKKADLGEDGTVVASQLPEMNYESPLKDNAAKDTPVDGDSLPLVDSADGSKTKRVLWSRVKAVLKAYFDTIYAAATHSHAWSAITGKPSSFAPAAHASTHGSGGTDPVTPAAIGAAAASHKHGAGDINSGTLDAARLPTVPLTKGGTGQTTAAKALYALINGSSTLAYSGAAAGDFLPLLDTSATTGKKISLENLINYMQLLGGVPKIATGSYTGTGTYGADNPCSLTFNFSPTLVVVSCWRAVSATTTRSVVGIFLRDDHGMRITQNTNYASRILYAAWAETSISWYSWDGDDDQLNYDGITYHYLAIG